MSEVRLLSSWDGYCGPCDDERPLALTETGPFGLRAWRSGTRLADRVLTLTCRLCGHGQIVGRDEHQDPEIVLTPEPEVAPFVLAAQQAPVWAEPEAEEPVAEVAHQEAAYAPVHEQPAAFEVPAEPAYDMPVTHPIALSPAPPVVPPPSYEPAPFAPAASYEPVDFVAPEEYAPIPVPRLQPPTAPEGADLATVLELLSQGLELAGPGATDRA
jgi:hypothetical protein